MTKARELSELGSYVNVSDGVTSVNNITVTSNLQLTTVVANGSVGTAGQVLSSNGSVVYWTAVASENTTYNLTTVANTFVNSGVIRLSDSNSSNDDIVIAGDGTTTVSSNSSQITISSSDQYLGTVTSVTGGDGLTGEITSAGSLSVGAGVGIVVNTDSVGVNANTGLVANASGLFVNSSYIATISVNSANNADYLDGQDGSYYAANSQLANYQTTAGLSGNVATLTANNATYAFGKTEGNLNVNSAQTALSANNADYLDGQDGSYYAANSQLANYQTTAGLSANVATLTSNNSLYLGGTAAASYQLNSTLSANVATLTSNNATYAFGKTEGNLNVNSAQTSLSANNADYLDGQDGSYYAANSQLANYALLSGATFSGAVTLNANLTLGAADHLILSSTSGISANGSYGTAGQMLTSNGSVAYWSTPQIGDITAVTAGNGLTGGGTSGDVTVNIGAGTGITVNADDIAVNAAYIATISANNATYLNGQLASYYTNATNITTGTLPYAQIPSNVVNTSANFTIAGAWTFNANVTLGAADHLILSSTSGISANGTYGTVGQVLHSNGSAVYWDIDNNDNTTYDLLAVANTEMNAGRIRLKDSSNANDDVIVSGSGTTTVSSNATHIIVNSADQYVGTVTSVGGGAGLTGSITTSGSLAVGAGVGITVNADDVAVNPGTGIVANATGVHVNGAYIATITVNSANNADYLDGQHGSYYAANSQLANYALLSGATFSGATTFNANVTLGAADHLILSSTSGISANGTYGTTGQVLASNGSATYWTTPTVGSVAVYSRASGVVTVTIVSGSFTVSGRSSNTVVYLQQV